MDFRGLSDDEWPIENLPSDRLPAFTLTSSPIFLIEEVCKSLESSIESLLEEHPFSTDENYQRVEFIIPVTASLFDQFFNSKNGYRAQYAQSSEIGQSYNRLLVEKISEIVLRNSGMWGTLLEKNISKSLLGTHSKIWFPRFYSEDNKRNLKLTCDILKYRRWKNFWGNNPFKEGLKAPPPPKEHCHILFNGTFVDASFNEYDQKPERHKDLYEKGWT